MKQKELNQYCRDSLALQTSDLFEQVQLKQVYPDGKTFADAMPKLPVAAILRKFDDIDDMTIEAFVQNHFELPAEVEVTAKHRAGDVKSHIDQLWPLLQKPADEHSPGSLLPLQNPYVIPGGRFREIYYWDSYFTALGLMDTNQESLVESMLNNFIDLQEGYGIIPNGNRSYYLTRSQPPVLGLIVELLMPIRQGNRAFLEKAVRAMEAEYLFWMNGSELLGEGHSAHRRVVKMPDGNLLNRYWDDTAAPRPESYREDMALAADMNAEQRKVFFRNVRAACESGWDFSSRWFADSGGLSSIRTTQIVPVDLNALLYKLETLLANYCQQLGEEQKSVSYQSCAAKRKQAMDDYLWCEQQRFYFDYDLDSGKRSKVWSLAGVVPLFVKAASQTQADEVAAQLKQRFLKSGGLVTTTNTTTQQWDSPNGWAPLHWFAVKGLMYSGHDELAIEIAKRWVNTVEGFFERSGKLMEKYDVCTPLANAGGGEYEVQEGFGWTNGVTKVLYRYI